MGHDILEMVGFRPFGSQPYFKQVSTEQRVVKTKVNRKTKNIAGEKTIKVQVPPPSVQTEKKKSTSIHIIKPQEPNKRETESRFISLVESWRRAWESKNFDAYIAHYHPGFKNKGKDLNAWKHYKKKLNERHRHISVKISDLKVRIDGNTAWAYFIQRFSSDAFRAKGYKLIEFRKEGDSWKIYRERSFAKKPGQWPA
jgi:ketosteroid isomerase-like protein